MVPNIIIESPQGNDKRIFRYYKAYVCLVCYRVISGETQAGVTKAMVFCSEIQENLDFERINFVKIRQNLRNRLILGGVEVTIR